MTISPEPQQELELTAEQVRILDEVIAHYQETRHGLKNLLAVIMAMAELAERNPTYAPRLIQCVLEKGPDMVAHMDHLARKLEAMKRGDT